MADTDRPDPPVSALERILADNPAAVGIIGEATNEYGTPVSVGRCATCGNAFTVCPTTTTERWGADCLGDECGSYDLARDVDVFFEPAAEAGLIERGDL